MSQSLAEEALQTIGNLFLRPPAKLSCRPHVVRNNLVQVDFGGGRPCRCAWRLNAGGEGQGPIWYTVYRLCRECFETLLSLQLR